MRTSYLAALAATCLAFATAAFARDEAWADRISVVVEGRGPDVVLIPGLASSRKVWDATAARLAVTHRVHRVQVAGFAGEPAAGNARGDVVAPVAAAVAAYVRDTRLKSPAVIGHSMGGEIVLMLAARYPEAISRGMVVDAAPFYSLIFDPAATPDGIRPRAAAFRDAMLKMPKAEQPATQAAAVDRLVKTEAAKPAIVADGLASDNAVVAEAMYELATTDLRPELARIKAPITIVYAYDPVFGVPPAAIDRLYGTAYAGLAGARLQRIDDSFHFVMIDQPDRFANAVDAFLKP